ncbi:MAG: hypothetical protein ACFBSE_20265 [Prochloraceae cyanobacterium]
MTGLFKLFFEADDNENNLIISQKNLNRIVGIDTKNIPSLSVAKDRLKIKSFIKKRLKQIRAEYNWLLGIISGFVLAGSYFSIMIIDRLLTEATIYTYSRAIITSAGIAGGFFIICNIILALVVRSTIINNSKNPKLTTLRGLIDDINSYNQAAKTFTDQIEIAKISGQNSSYLALKKKALVLEKVKTKLLKALKTERIIRKNPNFDPSIVAGNIVTHNANELNKNASSNNKELANQVEIGISIERELNS